MFRKETGVEENEMGGEREKMPGEKKGLGSERMLAICECVLVGGVTEHGDGLEKRERVLVRKEWEYEQSRRM